MQTILIMGSSGGLGTALTEHFADKNYNLALHYHESKPTVTPDKAKIYQADIREESNIKKMTEAIEKDFGHVDIVVHNAGISISEISWKVDSKNWNDTIAVNLTAPFLITKYLLPKMREQEFGRVIFISSIVAKTGFAGASAYAASKAGLIGLTKNLAKEVANKNITVNAIAPGYFNAGMINDVPDEMRKELIDQIPVNKLGEAKEFATLVEYLISEKASYMTGQTINLNGGLYS